ncbi:hypothetical protein BGY98DRAFT_374356 [Russula aff. rugulosa BPL654]|nr:hypothetical protein BGY98DRAFT_374356 [Russula aff. rugulosa BPL654]
MAMEVPTDGRRYGSAEGGGINWHMFLMMARRNVIAPQASHPRHLVLIHFALPTRSRLLTTGHGTCHTCTCSDRPIHPFHRMLCSTGPSFIPSWRCSCSSFVIFSIMMWRGNLCIRQLLHPSHFLTSAGLGFEEIACSKKCMFVVSPFLV